MFGFSFLIIAFFVFVVWLVFQQLAKARSELERTKREFFDSQQQNLKQLNEMQQRYKNEIESARRQSVSQSRYTLKGQVSEQLAPMLPDFPYLPSDCRFIGDPIDYVIFNGYTDNKDNLGSESQPMEVVLVDIKSCQARLSKGQNQIKQAIESGRVRFETIRISDEGIVHKSSLGSDLRMENDGRLFDMRQRILKKIQDHYR
ncbi:MAG: hypothetical protein Fur0016_08280 [Anaerolineales bacterium]